MAADKQLKRIRRQRLNRIGMISVIPYLTFAPIFANIFGNWGNVALAVGGLIGFSYALHEIREALKQEAQEALNSLPKTTGAQKLRGLLALGAGMASFAYIGESNLLNVAGISALAIGAATFAVGLPQFNLQRAEKPASKIDKLAQAKRPLEVALDEATQKLEAIASSAARMRDGQLRAQVFGVHDAAYAVIDDLKQNTADLPKARKFLVTYLDGAVKIVTGYAGHSDRHVSANMREKFSDTLVTLETTFIAQRKRLRDDKALDLDIQMDVLDAQMKGEGVL